MTQKKVIFLSVFTGLLLIAGSGFAAVVLPDPLGGQTFEGLLLKIADGVGTLIASLGSIMIIVAGILYLISAGSPERMGTAKKALIYAIIGIAIGVSAKAIVALIKSIIGTT